MEGDLHNVLCVTMEENIANIGDEYPVDSFHRIFWEQQWRAMQQTNPKSMKWKTAMIR